MEVQGAYSLAHHHLLSASGSFVKRDDSLGNGGSGRLIELGYGYYWPFHKQFTWGATALLGVGKMENHFPSANASGDGTDISAGVFRYGIQPYFGFKNKYLEAVVSSRTVFVNYSGVKGRLSYDGIDQVNYLKVNKSQLFFEPAFTLRLGYKYVFLQAQYVAALNGTMTGFPYDKSNFNVGIYVKYHLKERVKSHRPG